MTKTTIDMLKPGEHYIIKYQLPGTRSPKWARLVLLDVGRPPERSARDLGIPDSSLDLSRMVRGTREASLPAATDWSSDSPFLAPASRPERTGALLSV